MANINISVEEFICTPPTIGTTYREISSGTYLLNYDWIGDVYENWGMNVKVRLFYIGDNNPEQEYTTSNLPNKADSFPITGLNYDGVDFKLVFEVDEGLTCQYTFSIPYSSIVII